MRLLNKILNCSLLFAAYLLITFSFQLSAQTKPQENKPKQIELIRATQLDFSKYNYGQYKRLVGDVIFKHENSWLYCDSAYLYTEKNSVEAFGNVHIDENDTLNVYGKYLKYDGNTKLAELHDSVVMIDRSMKLFTNHLFYDLNTRIARYDSSGKIINKKNTLTSWVGMYFSKDQMLFFKDTVVLVNPKYTMRSDTLKYNTDTEIAYFFGPTHITSSKNYIYCENGWYDTRNDIAQFNKKAFFQEKEQTIRGDSLYYNRKKGFARAIRNITIQDTIQKIIITGNYAEFYDSTETSFVTDSALFIRIMEKDTFWLHADTLRNYKDSVAGDTTSYRKLFAYYKTRFYKSDMQGRCDSLVYQTRDSLIKMFTKPVLWTQDNQLTAEYIEIKTSGKKIHSFVLKDNGFIISERDSGQFNQVKGNTIYGYFTDNDLKKVYVEGDGKTLYYLEDEDSLLIGINKSESENILIYLNNKEIQTITFLNKPVATLYPEKQIPEDELRLKNFEWLIRKKPLNWKDVFKP